MGQTEDVHQTLRDELVLILCPAALGAGFNQFGSQTSW